MSGETDIVGLETLSVGDRVELRFPARGDLVVLARLVTSAISSRAGFDIEELEDLRLAVGELCLLALEGSDRADGELHLEFSFSAQTLDISCTRSTLGELPDARSSDAEARRLSDQILSALVDEHGCAVSEGEVRAWLRKARRGSLA